MFHNFSKVDLRSFDAIVRVSSSVKVTQGRKKAASRSEEKRLCLHLVGSPLPRLLVRQMELKKEHALKTLPKTDGSPTVLPPPTRTYTGWQYCLVRRRPSACLDLDLGRAKRGSSRVIVSFLKIP